LFLYDEIDVDAIKDEEVLEWWDWEHANNHRFFGKLLQLKSFNRPLLRNFYENLNRYPDRPRQFTWSSSIRTYFAEMYSSLVPLSEKWHRFNTICAAVFHNIDSAGRVTGHSLLHGIVTSPNDYY
jgi:hypothetical protein